MTETAEDLPFLAESLDLIEGLPGVHPFRMVAIRKAIETRTAQLAAAQTRIEELEKALTEIAAFDDKLAEEHLKATGSFGGFDEPGSVQMARAALSTPLE